MLLEMYLDGQVVEITTLIPSLWQTKRDTYIKSLVAELEKKHADLLKKASGKPCYCLSGVPSCINDFTPLHHPIASAPTRQDLDTKVQAPDQVSLKLVDKNTEAERPVTVEKMPQRQSGKVA